MKNNEHYHFSDFTTNNFRKLIKKAKENYTFRLNYNFNKDEKFIIWSHDVDCSMHRARKLARIENEEGIIANYFLLLHNRFYNLFEKEITQCVRDIIDLGHEIGLHFDVDYYRINDVDKLQKYLQKEKKLLEDFFQIDIKTFSFHDPTSFALSCKDWQYGGMINTYAAYFQDNVEYCSDSNGYWIHKRLYDMLDEAKAPRLQALTHPVWWQDEIMSPKERIWRCIEGRAENCKNKYIKGLEDFGRINVDG